jgi:hypothetical protein
MSFEKPWITDRAVEEVEFPKRKKPFHQSQMNDKGNLKYKIWNPADHYDHGFIKGKDKHDGIYTVESLDRSSRLLDDR